MQCPECHHIPLAGNQPDPNRCPECGIFYQKAIEMRRARKKQAEVELSATRPNNQAISPVVRGAMYDYKGAQPVVVLDIRMSFGSMVMFMVKWALAAIPALLMLMVIGFIAMALFGGVIGGLMR